MNGNFSNSFYHKKAEVKLSKIAQKSKRNKLKENMINTKNLQLLPPINYRLLNWNKFDPSITNSLIKDSLNPHLENIEHKRRPTFPSKKLSISELEKKFKNLDSISFRVEPNKIDHTCYTSEKYRKNKLLDILGFDDIVFGSTEFVNYFETKDRQYEAAKEAQFNKKKCLKEIERAKQDDMLLKEIERKETKSRYHLLFEPSAHYVPTVIKDSSKSKSGELVIEESNDINSTILDNDINRPSSLTKLYEESEKQIHGYIYKLCNIRSLFMKPEIVEYLPSFDSRTTTVDMVICDDSITEEILSFEVVKVEKNKKKSFSSILTSIMNFTSKCSCKSKSNK